MPVALSCIRHAHVTHHTSSLLMSTSTTQAFTSFSSRLYAVPPPALSLVRRKKASSSGGGGIGFVSDDRRINVGLTRARCSLIVIGNSRALQADGNWAALIYYALEKNMLFRPKVRKRTWCRLLLATLLEATGLLYLNQGCYIWIRVWSGHC